MSSLNSEFTQVYEDFYYKLNGYLKRLSNNGWIAEDITQETFVRYFEKANTIRESEKINAWMYRVAYNLYLDHLRKEQSNDVLGNDSEIQNSCCCTDKMYEKTQMNNCVQSKMKQLSLEYRTILHLSDELELSLNEISSILGISIENVKVRIHRARKKLKNILNAECELKVDEESVVMCVVKQC
jgi:RNA polymerase sigma-70 factor (ECF subfamily)